MEDFWMEHRYSSCCYQLEPHYEHTYQLVFLLKGKILYQVGEKQYEVSKGGMILLNSLEEHTLKVLEYPYERYIRKRSIRRRLFPFLLKDLRISLIFLPLQIPSGIMCMM